MDAKPLRGFKFYDENAIPTTQHKILHSRNKSSPSLSTLVAKGGAFKMAAKRSAFGDISQTTRGNRPLTEMSVMGKDIKSQQEKKTSMLLLPAQKPISMSNVSNIQPLSEVSQNAQTKKVLAKRATTIFKDYSTLPQKAQTDENLLRNSDSVAQLHANQKSESVVQLPEPVPTHSIEIYPRSHSNLLAGLADLHIPVIPIEKDRTLPIKVSTVTVPPKKSAVGREMPVMVDKRSAEAKIMSILHSKDVVIQQPIEPLPVKPTERREYFDSQTYIEEDYDENFEDDGYVTARSYRSKPDNLTEGNFTTILKPKISREIERELQAAAAVISSLREPAGIDDDDWDISMVSEYKDEIFDYYLELEGRLAPNAHYMDFQTEIQWSMRSVLIDWVVQVHDRFQLLPETLFLTVNIIDRFLSIKIVSINKLQLVGATALFVASKYEEVNCPTLKEMVFMVDNSYDEEEILKAERFMLTLLGFDLGWPGPMSFLRRISTADEYDLETRTVAKYFLELTIMDEKFIECPPSFVSAGAHCLARLMLNKGHWSTAHVHYSGYTYIQLQPLLVSMLECLEDPMHHHNAIYEKYCNKRFRGAASFSCDEIRRGFRLLDVQTNTAINFDQLCRSDSIFEYVYRDIPGYCVYVT